MAKRGRPRMRRPPSEVITQSGLTVGQRTWLNRNWRGRGFASGAHLLRYIVNQYIAQVESGKEDHFQPDEVPGVPDPIVSAIPRKE